MKQNLIVQIAGWFMIVQSALMTGYAMYSGRANFGIAYLMLYLSMIGCMIMAAEYLRIIAIDSKHRGEPN